MRPKRPEIKAPTVKSTKPSSKLHDNKRILRPADLHSRPASRSLIHQKCHQDHHTSSEFGVYLFSFLPPGLRRFNQHSASSQPTRWALSPDPSSDASGTSIRHPLPPIHGTSLPRDGSPTCWVSHGLCFKVMLPWDHDQPWSTSCFPENLPPSHGPSAGPLGWH